MGLNKSEGLIFVKRMNEKLVIPFISPPQLSAASTGECFSSLCLLHAVHFIFGQAYILIWAIPGNSVDVVELLRIFTKVTKLRRYINIYIFFLFCLFFSSVPSLSVLYICIAASILHFRGIFPEVSVPWNTVFSLKGRNDFVVWHWNTWGISTELTVWMLTESAGDK